MPENREVRQALRVTGKGFKNRPRQSASLNPRGLNNSYNRNRNDCVRGHLIWVYDADRYFIYTRVGGAALNLTHRQKVTKNSKAKKQIRC